METEAEGAVAKKAAYEFLCELDSHTVYSTTKLEQLGKPFTVKHIQKGKYEISIPGASRPMWFSNAQQMQDRINSRGKGGGVDEDAADEYLFGGFEIAEELCMLVLGVNPAMDYSGLGFRFRACLTALTWGNEDESS